jgi:predicted CXXCH cytochrome family protein
MSADRSPGRGSTADRPTLWLATALTLLFLVSGCSEDERPEPSERSASAAEPDAAATQTPRIPLPRFEGPRLDGGTAGTDLFRRRRGLVYVFSSADRESDRIAGIVRRIEEPARRSNAAILGVNRDADREAALRFVRKHGFEFPVVADLDLTISRKLRVPPASSMVLAVDAEGFLLGGFAHLEEEIPEPELATERALRELLYLDGAGEVEPALGVLPRAPDARVVSLDGKPLELSTLQGKVAVLVIFSPLCPHCQVALRFLADLSKELASPDLAIVPVSVLDRRYLIEDLASREKFDFPLYLDVDSSVQKAYAHRLAVPDTLVITRDGLVFARHEGFSERIQALLTMEIRQTLGVQNVLLLDRVGYSGAEACRICHGREHETWSLTNHAYAFETLVEHGVDRDPECLPCHTVGWNEKGGYGPESRLEHLEGVQCESCHGRGGPHQSPDFLKQGFEALCTSCHNPKHSLNFELGSRLPLVSHAANVQHTSLSLDERRRLIGDRDRRSRELFHAARFVGSRSCEGCHPAQHEQWAGTAHARAFDTLRKGGEEARPECQRCHTTGFEKEGGFPRGGEGLAQVGCESCHGPGGEHVTDGAPKRGTILKLADKCDSCVLLQICGACHDEANDPGFEFELLDKLEEIRHAMATARRAP